MANFAEIKQSVSFADTIELLELKGEWRGDEWRGACTACKSGGDRALVVTEGKTFRCFACNGDKSKNGSGSVIDLTAHIQKVSIKEAAEWLSRTEGRDSPNRGVPETPEQKPTNGKTGTFDRAKYQASLNRTHELLKDIPPDLITRLDLGVPDRGSLKGLVNFPLYDSNGTFVCYGASTTIQLPKTIK